MGLTFARVIFAWVRPTMAFSRVEAQSPQKRIVGGHAEEWAGLAAPSRLIDGC